MFRSIWHALIYMTISSTCMGDFNPKDLTLEQKVGQLIVTHFHGETANSEAQLLIQEIGVGGVIYYNWSNSLHSPEQVKALSEGLKSLAVGQTCSIPLFIMVDQEGGRVARLTQGFSPMPANHDVGLTNNPLIAEKIAYEMGLELASVGINMNLAPVVDIDESAKTTYIASRSFGDTPEKVIAFAESAVNGYNRANIICTFKHFPGHGSVTVDSHYDLPVVKKTKAELASHEFLPFKVLANSIDAVMTAHILVPEIDAENCATLSKPLLDILRDELGFKGVIISDSLVMEGLLKSCASIDEAAIKAFNAGCDLILLGGKQLVTGRGEFELSTADIVRIHSSLVEAVKAGVISQERLDSAVERILTLKTKYLAPN